MEEKKLVKQFIELGVSLIECGSEIARVETGISRILASYQYRDISVFALPAYMIITVTLKNDEVFTISKATGNHSIDFDRFASLNQLLRDLEIDHLEAIEIEEKIAAIRGVEHRKSLQIIGYGLGAFGFTGIFGGSLNDCVCAFFIGLSVFGINYFLVGLKINRLVRTFIEAAFIALAANSLVYPGWCENLDTLQIGALMLLVPGLAITNSLRDFIDEDYLSGISRIIEALMIAIAIALGVGLVMGVLK